MVSRSGRPLRFRNLVLSIPLGIGAANCSGGQSSRDGTDEPLGHETLAVNSAPIQVRLHQFVINDDGGGTPLSSTTMQDEVAIANQAFAAAGVTFLFDPNADVTTINSTVLNASSTAPPPPGGTEPDPTHPDFYLAASARDHLSRKYPGKLAIFRMERGDG